MLADYVFVALVEIEFRRIFLALNEQYQKISIVYSNNLINYHPKVLGHDVASTPVL